MGKDFGGYLVRACMKSGGISGVVLLVYMIFSPNHFLEAVPSWKVILILLTFSSSFAVLRLFAELFMERVIYLCDTYASALSALNRWVKSLQLDAGVGGGELPVHLVCGGVARLLPGADRGGERLLLSDPPAQALAAQGA